MQREALRKTLEQLKTELESTERFDQETRDLVAAVMGQMTKVLARTAEAEPEIDTREDDESVIGLIENTIEKLEEDHPKVAALLANLVTTLERMGF